MEPSVVGDSISLELHEEFREYLDYINDIVTIHYMWLSTGTLLEINTLYLRSSWLRGFSG